MKHFNKLTPAELERLAILSEECGELIQAIGKIIRHGFNNSDPTNKDHKGNRHDLCVEMADVVEAVYFCMDKGDVSIHEFHSLRISRVGKLKKYLHHN